MANEVVKHKAVAPEVTTRRILPTVKTSRNIEVTEMLKCPACGAQMMVMGRGERCAVIAKMDPASLWFDQVAFTCPGAKECQICARCIKPWLTCTCPWGHARFIPWYAAAIIKEGGPDMAARLAACRKATDERFFSPSAAATTSNATAAASNAPAPPPPVPAAPIVLTAVATAGGYVGWCISQGIREDDGDPLDYMDKW